MSDPVPSAPQGEGTRRTHDCPDADHPPETGSDDETPTEQPAEQAR
jgi:hypothetical protein